MVEVTPARLDDAAELVADLRDQDAEECRAAGVVDVLAAVHEGISMSSPGWTARVDGRVACIFGAVPVGTILAPVAVVWMLGTPLVASHGRTLQHLAPEYIRTMLQTHHRLINRVHARNTVAVRWLRRMGFTLHAAQLVPPHGEPFHFFEMTDV